MKCNTNQRRINKTKTGHDAQDATLKGQNAQAHLVIVEMLHITFWYRHQNRISSQQIIICVCEGGIPASVLTPLHILYPLHELSAPSYTIICTHIQRVHLAQCIVLDVRQVQWQNIRHKSRIFFFCILHISKCNELLIKKKI